MVAGWSFALPNAPIESTKAVVFNVGAAPHGGAIRSARGSSANSREDEKKYKEENTIELLFLKHYYKLNLQ